MSELSPRMREQRQGHLPAGCAGFFLMTEFFFIFDVALTFQNFKLSFVLSKKVLLGDE